MESQKCENFSKKFEIDEIEFCPYAEKKNALASSISVLHK